MSAEEAKGFEEIVGTETPPRYAIGPAVEPNHEELWERRKRLEKFERDELPQLLLAGLSTDEAYREAGF